MSHSKEDIAGKAVESGVEHAEAVSEESQEGALEVVVENAELSLQNEIDSMEQMMRDMLDMDEDSKAIMQEQIDQMKAELGATPARQEASETDEELNVEEVPETNEKIAEALEKDFETAIAQVVNPFTKQVLMHISENLHQGKLADVYIPAMNTAAYFDDSAQHAGETAHDLGRLLKDLETVVSGGALEKDRQHPKIVAIIGEMQRKIDNEKPSGIRAYESITAGMSPSEKVAFENADLDADPTLTEVQKAEILHKRTIVLESGTSLSIADLNKKYHSGASSEVQQQMARGEVGFAYSLRRGLKTGIKEEIRDGKVVSIISEKPKDWKSREKEIKQQFVQSYRDQLSRAEEDVKRGTERAVQSEAWKKDSAALESLRQDSSAQIAKLREMSS